MRLTVPRKDGMGLLRYAQGDRKGAFAMTTGKGKGKFFPKFALKQLQIANDNGIIRILNNSDDEY